MQKGLHKYVPIQNGILKCNSGENK